MTLVYYFVPEDNETEESMNAFAIAKDLSEIKMEDLKRNFPLHGTYRFTFKVKFNRQLVFIHSEEDTEDTQIIPSSEGKVIVKANRLSWLQHGHSRKGQLKQSNQFVCSNESLTSQRVKDFWEKRQNQAPLGINKGSKKTGGGSFGFIGGLASKIGFSKAPMKSFSLQNTKTKNSQDINQVPGLHFI